MSPADPATVPRIHPKARLQWDEVRGRDVLLYPEGLVALNPTGAEILKLCDGVRGQGALSRLPKSSSPFAASPSRKPLTSRSIPAAP